jgi:8-oxo-dGTP pyrophosphatase MutT (NUDIX family)
MINNKIKISNKIEILKVKKKLEHSFDDKKCFNLSNNVSDITKNYKNFTKSAVLCLLVSNSSNYALDIVLTKRSKHLRHHKGQISFPGGKLEPQDKGDFEKCAYREAYEEIGFKKNKVVYLGKLNKYITGSGFLIQPIVVLVEEVQSFIINRKEVTSILHFPINYLLSEDVISKVFLDEAQNKYFLNIYWKKNKIWGATAKILIDLINLLKK